MVKQTHYVFYTDFAQTRDKYHFSSIFFLAVKVRDSLQVNYIPIKWKVSGTDVIPSGEVSLLSGKKHKIREDLGEDGMMIKEKEMLLLILFM